MSSHFVALCHLCGGNPSRRIWLLADPMSKFKDAPKARRPCEQLTGRSDRNTLHPQCIDPMWGCVVRNQTPLAPGQPISDITVHIVLNDFGPLGLAYCETDEVEADKETVVEDILRGQYSHPLRVVAFNTAEGWSRDITEDIARAVLERGRAESRPIGTATREFIKRALGADAS